MPRTPVPRTRGTGLKRTCARLRGVDVEAVLFAAATAHLLWLWSSWPS